MNKTGNDELAPLPWKVSGIAKAVIIDAQGQGVAYVVGRHPQANTEYILRCVAATRMEEVFNQHNPIGMNAIAEEIHDWANKVFPERGLGSMALKLYEEIGEWLRDPSSRSEFADVMIMLLDAAIKCGITDIDRAILEKLSINRNRAWKISALGVMSHQEER